MLERESGEVSLSLSSLPSREPIAEGKHYQAGSSSEASSLCRPKKGGAQEILLYLRSLLLDELLADFRRSRV